MSSLMLSSALLSDIKALENELAQLDQAINERERKIGNLKNEIQHEEGQLENDVNMRDQFSLQLQAVKQRFDRASI